jgi:hypothetical protein
LLDPTILNPLNSPKAENPCEIIQLDKSVLGDTAAWSINAYANNGWLVGVGEGVLVGVVVVVGVLVGVSVGVCVGVSLGVEVTVAV